MEEQKYPIYKFWAKWDQDNYENNFTGFNKMYRATPTAEELENDFNLFKESIEKNCVLLRWIESGYKYVEDESWVLKWFSHLTYNLFEKEEDAFESFHKFVNRKIKFNIDNGQWATDYRDYNKPYYCLMGAEDAWRWKLCGCDECKKIGQTAITH
jgi:hypothetical protein